MTDWRGTTFDVRLGPPGHGGFCVARHEGRVVFVRHGLPDELVRVRVTEDRGGSFCRADAIEILAASPDRVPATCPVSGPGGAGCCDFSFATPAAQRALKAAVVVEQLRRIAGTEREVTVQPIAGYPADVTGGWRTRVRLVVDAEGRAGVHGYRSTEVITDLRCPQPVSGAMDGIADRLWTPGADLVIAVDGDGMRHIVELAPSAVGRDERAGERPGARGGRGADRRGGDRRGGRGAGRARGRDSDRHGGSGADRSGERGADRRAAERRSADRGPGGERDADRRRASARRAATHAARDEWVMGGSGRTVEYVAGRRWELSATGFWQAHRGAAHCYSDLVADWAGLGHGERAWDLYSGVGVFAARLADQVGQTGSVLAVESARSAVADGIAALRDMPWLDLRAQRVEHWLAEHASSAAPEVVVLDPPRAGAGKEVVTAVTTSGPARIIHVGCDPASFARDLGLYQAAGYHLAALRAFDAFPATHHVECLALLER
ncbi:class I SAM-dependent RNA methyltransferase [Nocardia sp. NBC_00565]|uniref:class I SAM-dependent RNA methyltransferase n=1 Tax=Nocardia sp. NBC_00565 TaxID=2975993 RepID=UPI002E816DD2|nr:TRAM domain-containing protein [Nocardia sp. NBC_00565]WUC07298.1 class I SAM-dependent RNA methyltransferase [Nocardia sp. NBC_00565]